MITARPYNVETKPRYQVFLVYADDEGEFEDSINRQLDFVGEDFVNIRFFKSRAWHYAACIIYHKER